MSSGRVVPPLAARILSIVLPRALRDSLLIDLEEAAMHPTRRFPRLWYWGQTFRALWPPTLLALRGTAPQTARAGTHWRITGQAMGADLRLAARRMGRAPGLAFGVAFLLTAGVASGGVVFSIYSELLHPRVGVPAADVLQALTIVDSTGLVRRSVDREWVDDLRRRQGSSMLVYSTARDGVVRYARTPHNERVALVSPDYYHLVGARAAIGRLPVADPSGARREALVSYRLWSSALGGDAAALGQVLHVNRTPYMIAGVAPPDFDGLEGAAVWIPLDADAARTARVRLVELYARVDSPTNATASTTAIASSIANRLRAENPRQAAPSVRFLPVREARSGSSERGALRSSATILAALCALVLLAACANTANLLGMEVLGRSHEIAVRAALGASRLRLARQLLVEYGLHAAIGVALSLVATTAVLRSIPRWLPIDETAAARFAMQPSGIALVCACAVLAMTIAVVLPLRRALGAAARLRSFGIARVGAGRSVSALVVLQIAQTVVLLTTAVTLARSESLVRRRPIGFDGVDTHVLIYALPRALYDSASARVFHRRVLQSLRETTGITAAIAAPTPLVGFESTSLTRAGSATGISVRRTVVSGDYFAVIGNRVVEGRALVDSEPAPAMVVSRGVARSIAGRTSALGLRVRLLSDSLPYVIVGVMEDGTYGGNDPAPVVLTSLSNRTTYAPTIVVRSRLSRREVESVTRATVARFDVDIPVTVLGSLTTLLDRVRLLTVLMRALALAFCAVAIVVSAFGLYAHLARYVSSRAAELGLRVALGATPTRLALDLTRRSMRLAAVGLIVGLLGASWVRSLLANMLFGVQRGDPVVLGAVTGITALLVLTATVVPGWRVSRTDAARVLAET